MDMERYIMSYAIDRIARTLKNARKAKGLSQRALSDMAGVPQSHISNIEGGRVDLRLSSLVQLARVLDLELTLVPRKSVSAVHSIVRGSRDGRIEDRTSVSAKSAVNELKRLHAQLDGLKHLSSTHTELAQAQRQLRDLQRLEIPLQDLDKLREINKMFKTFTGAGDFDALRRLLHELRELRNSIAHSDSFAMTTKVRPAYSLEEDDDGD